MSRESRMFHVLVTLGIAAAAGSACSGKSGTSANSRRGSGTGGHTTGGASGTGGASAATGGIGFPTGGAGGSSGAGVGEPSFGGEGGAGCEHTEQLFCEAYDPVPIGCVCYPDAPVTERDCGSGRIACASYDPPMGCHCANITGPI